MADTQTASRDAPLDRAATGPSITPRRSLPGGRAVVGAFLVVLAAVGTFGAYLQATASPTTTYLVTTRALEVGEVLTEEDAASSFESVAVELPEPQADNAVRASQRSALVGTVVVAPVAAEDLLLVSAVQPVGTADPGVQLSFELPPSRAVGGRLAVGERVDVIGTFSAGGQESVTRVVARQVVVVATPQADDGISGGRVLLTVQVPDLATAQRLQHAVDVADVAILRGADVDAPDPAPITGLDSSPGAAGQGDEGAAEGAVPTGGSEDGS